MPNSEPRQIQFTPFTAEHFKTTEGISFVNLQLSEIVRALNQSNGTAGTVVLKEGVDVAGSKVTGLGSPENETDAVSLGHADANYSSAAAAENLDVGGKNALKGLTNVYLMMGQSLSGSFVVSTPSGNKTITVVGGLIKSAK